MDPSKANVNVGLSDLLSGSYKPSASDMSATPPKLSLTVPPASSPTDSGAIHRNLPSHPSKTKKQALLDLQHTDILGPSEVVKRLLTLPYTHRDEYFALHRLGNTLVLDSVAGMGDEEGNQSSQSPNRNNSQSRIGARSNNNQDDVTASSPSDKNILAKLQHLEHLDIDSEASSPNSSPTSGISSMYSNSMGSTFLPPAEYYLPTESQPHSQPFRQVLRWQLSDVTFATGSDLVVYSTPQHPSLTLGPVDTSKSLSNVRMTCLDYYLDNMMAAVPELALCLHSKGFLRGVSVCPTDGIPTLHTGDPNFGLGQHGTSQGSSFPLDPSKPISLQGDIDSDRKGSSEALFDPQVVEFNALAILRFLQQTCSKENGTYILHRKGECNDSGKSNTNSGDSIQVYDLEAMSALYQRKWKWLLAMVSHRFALRLSHHHAMSNAVSREMLADRQLSLLNTCHDLLLECRDLDKAKVTVGQEEEHQKRPDDRTTGTIRAAVLEQMADIHLKKAQSSRKGQLAQNSTARMNAPPDFGNNFPHQLSKSQKKKANKKKHTGTVGCTKGPALIHESSRTNASSSTTARSLEALTKNMQVVQPSTPGSFSESSADAHNIDDTAIEMDTEPINYVEKISLSIDMLLKAMCCVLEDINFEQKSTCAKKIDNSDGDNSEGVTSTCEKVDDVLPPIIIGNMSCTPIIAEESLKTISKTSVSTSSNSSSHPHIADQDSDDSALSSSYTIQLSLVMQFTGLLHKVLLACHALVVEKLDVIPENGRRKRSVSFSGDGGSGKVSSSQYTSSGSSGTSNRRDNGCAGVDASNFSRVSDCVKLLSDYLLPHCLEWLKVTNALKLERAHLNKSSRRHRGHLDSNLEECETGAFSSFSFQLDDDEEDDDLQDLWSMDRTMLADLPLLWDIIGTLCRSISTATAVAKSFEECEPILLTWREECELPVKRLVHVMFVINVLSSRRDGLDDLESVFREDFPSHGESELCLHSARFDRIAKLSILSDNENGSESCTIWSTLCGCKEKSPESEHPACEVVFTNVLHPLYSRLLSAIRVIPRDNIDCQLSEGDRFPLEDLLMILKIQAFCFLMATLLISRAQSTWGQVQWSDSSLHVISKPKESKKLTKRDGSSHSNESSMITAACGLSSTEVVPNSRSLDVPRCKFPSPFRTHSPPYFLSLSISGASTHKVVLFVRHLADACNELGQAFASRLEELKVIPCDLKSPFEGDCAVSRLGLSFDIFHQRAVKDSSMAESYYSSAISLFDCLSSSSDEIRNVIAAECNRSSLKRLLAIRSSEFIRDALGPLLPLTKESQNQSEEGIVRYHKLLSIISRAVLGKKGIFYSFAMSSAASKKKKNGLLNNSSTLILEDESLLAYKYEPLNYIEEGISICERMQKKAESLGSNATISKNDPGMKMVINEMARHHFLKGIMYNQCIKDISAAADAAVKEMSTGMEITEYALAALSTRDEHIQYAIECFQQAKQLFESLHMTRQKEMANYHLGALYVTLWRRYMDEYSQLTDHAAKNRTGGDTYSLLRLDSRSGSSGGGGIKVKVENAQNAAMETLGKAMTYYGTAHEYYLKYDVNPTLVRILIDMCDIYLTSYLDCEPAIVSEINCIRQLMDSGAKSTERKETDNYPSCLLPQSTNESITSLLGGAFKVVLDCRFAMTEAVVGRYPVEMAPLSIQVAEHLKQLLLKVLRILVLLPSRSEVDRVPEKEKEECIKMMKHQYTQLLTLTNTSIVASDDGKDRAGEQKTGDLTVSPCPTLYTVLDKLNSSVYLRMFLWIHQ